MTNWTSDPASPVSVVMLWMDKSSFTLLFSFSRQIVCVMIFSPRPVVGITPWSTEASSVVLNPDDRTCFFFLDEDGKSFFSFLLPQAMLDCIFNRYLDKHGRNKYLPGKNLWICMNLEDEIARLAKRQKKRQMNVERAGKRDRKVQARNYEDRVELERRHKPNHRSHD